MSARRAVVIDLDNTLCVTQAGDYANAEPISEVVEALREFHDQGFEIVIHTSRNMRTHQNNVGRITAKTVPVILDWLQRNEIPFDEIVVGKPWCGSEGFYVDDRAIRPSEFVALSDSEIQDLLRAERGEDLQ